MFENGTTSRTVLVNLLSIPVAFLIVFIPLVVTSSMGFCIYYIVIEGFGWWPSLRYFFSLLVIASHAMWFPAILVVGIGRVGGWYLGGWD